MQSFLLPLFPLGIVLFPDTPLPLHIFEERYKEMIRLVLQKKEEFGVVLAGKKGVAHIGCTASIEEVLQKYPDGRMDILTMGRRRFEISSLNEEKEYLQAEVTYFEDFGTETVPMDLRKKATDLFRQHQPEKTVDLFSSQLSFDLAGQIEDVELKQVILSMRSEKDRLEHLLDQVPTYLNRHKLTDRIRYIAPLNGHSKHFMGGHS